MTGVSGIIFSNLHDRNIPELTKKRTTGAIPFGGRYRLIDFPLSSMVNSGIDDIYVISHHNYNSLVEHIGSGKDWDLARHNGGIKMLSPYITAYATSDSEQYVSRLESLKSISYSISKIKNEYIVLCDCNRIFSTDLTDIVRSHIQSGADITLGIGRATDSADNSIVETDEFGFVTGIAKNVGKTDSDSVNLNIYVATREHLISMINDAMMRGYSSFSHEMLLRGRTEHKDKIGTYRFAETFIGVSSLIDYYNAGMAIVEDKDLYFSLFERSNFSVMTKVTNSAPTRYTKTASVHNSLIADGCYIAGNVENSIIFPGVHIASGSSVKNSIIFSDTYIGCNTCLSSVITDKNVMIGENVSLLGIPTLPIMVEEGRKL